jgi:enoyl-CoA hydratase/carnithine racemase
VDYLASVGASQVQDGEPPCVTRSAGVRLFPVSSLPDTDYRNLLVTHDGSAARIVLNRPEKRNALSLELMEEIIASLRELSAQRDARAIVIEGAGPAFSAGHDLSEMIGRDREFLAGLFDRCSVMMATLHEVPQPVIAKVHGIATAAGCQLVAACDLAVAAEGTRFATPGVKIGLFCSTPMVALTRAVGRKRAMEMLLTGRMIDAQTAADWGLVNKVVPPACLEAETRKLASQIAEASSFTVALGKQAYYKQIDLDQGGAYAYTKEVMSRNAMADDAQEGISAFLDKRKACWKGK